ncbi:MAG TPA: IclR family transcriptional regulator [Syntrophorhabdaceae bacterium]|nr:IclR family transcriptional regulator [Syntrophorhabdaceae bacterium]
MYDAPVIKKALDVLKLIVESNKSLGVTEIARALRLSKSTVFGILKALQDTGFITKSKTSKRYAVGQELFKLSKTVLQGDVLTTIARPFLEKLVELVDETAFLCAREDNAIKVLDTIETRKKLKISSPIGTRFPITASVFCKAFLSTLGDDEIRSFLKERGLPKYTENSVTDINRFLTEIVKVRETGYSLDLEEYHMGVRAIASLIYSNGYPVASVSILGFTGSMTDDKIGVVAKHIVNTARDISDRLSQ